MPDSPDRQVPPPPPEGGAAPIPDVSSRPGQVPRSRPERRTSTPRPSPPTRGPLGGAVPTPPMPPAPPGDVSVPSEAVPTARRAPNPRQPLSQRDGARTKGERPSARERLQRLATQHARGQQRESRTEGPRPTPPVGSPKRASQVGEKQVVKPRVQPSSPGRIAGPTPDAPGRSIPKRGPQAAPIVPEPPAHQPALRGSGRIPEPPARTSAQDPTRRRPTNRILEALDAKLAADQADQAKEKVARRERDDAVRRVRPALSPRRPTPPKAPTPSVTSSVPIAPRAPQPKRGLREVETPPLGASSAPVVGDAVVPLPDPSVPPVPVIPLKPTSSSPLAAAIRSEATTTAAAQEPTEDPLSASYERLVKAAKRQAALEAALAPEAALDESAPEHQGIPEADWPERQAVESPDRVPAAPDESAHEAPAPAVVLPADAVDSAPGAEPALGDLHDEFEQAKRDAERFFGPDDFTPPEAEGSLPDSEPDLTADEASAPVEVDHTALAQDDPDAEAVAPMSADDVIIPEEVTPPSGMAIVSETADIEDAEIVPDTRSSHDDDIIGTIIATDLDLITSPEDVDMVDPDEMAVDEAILDEMPVSDDAIDEALATAPDRVVKEPEQPEPPAIEPPAEETPPQSRGFRVLTGVLILSIFALVCIAAYRMMMRPGGGMVDPTPTPIVPTEQTERPGASASPSRSPKASETTPVPALPPREPLPSDAAIPPALPGQSSTPEVMGGAGNLEIGQHTIALSQINEVNLPGLIDKPVAGENVQVQSILGDGAYVWVGSDQDNRVLAMIPEPYRAALKDLQAGDRVDFVGTLASADEPEILAPEQGRDRLIRQGAAIAVRDITVRR